MHTGHEHAVRNKLSANKEFMYRHKERDTHKKYRRCQNISFECSRWYRDILFQTLEVLENLVDGDRMRPFKVLSFDLLLGASYFVAFVLPRNSSDVIIPMAYNRTTSFRWAAIPAGEYAFPLHQQLDRWKSKNAAFLRGKKNRGIRIMLDTRSGEGIPLKGMRNSARHNTTREERPEPRGPQSYDERLNIPFSVGRRSWGGQVKKVKT